MGAWEPKGTKSKDPKPDNLEEGYYYRTKDSKTDENWDQGEGNKQRIEFDLEGWRAKVINSKGKIQFENKRLNDDMVTQAPDDATDFKPALERPWFPFSKILLIKKGGVAVYWVPGWFSFMYSLLYIVLIGSGFAVWHFGLLDGD